jgi:o-succinylbenzoate---CoA ligase
MNPFPKHITLNGKRIPVEVFTGHMHNTDQEREVAAFLKEWYSRDNFIEVRTSGSTGTPKIIRLKKEFVSESAERTLNYFQLHSGDRVLHCLPLKFIAGRLMVVRALTGRLNLYLAEPETDFSFLQKEKFRFAAMVPHQVKKILDSEPYAGKWMKNIEILLLGGSAVPHAVEMQLQNVSTACYSGYGMTETATHIALRKLNGNPADEFYHCLGNVHVGLSENGCLQVFMRGITKQPLQTTDLAELRNDKTFRILGRSDHIIISGGIKFSPGQLEKKLENRIKESFLFSSLPHESLGEQLVLVVEGKESREAVARVLDICRSRLEKFEQPRQIIFVSDIPKTGSGKPDRLRLLRKK